MEIPLSLARLDATGRPAKGPETPSSLVYGIPLWYRAASVAIALILVAANAAGSGEPGWKPGVFGIVVALAAILAALYEERWRFDAASRAIQSRLGLVFAARRTDFSFDDVSRLRLDLFVKGRLDQSVAPPADKMPRGSQMRLIIELKDGQGFLVDSVAFKSRQRLERAGREIASLIGVDLE